MLEKYDDALQDAERVLSLSPHWPRGYVRKAVALLGHNRVDGSMSVIDEGLRVAPDDTMLQELKTQVESLSQSRELKRKAPEASTFSSALSQIKAVGSSFSIRPRKSGMSLWVGVSEPLPVVVLSGFLGAGKTTLLNRILKETHGKEHIAILVNDMAAVNIDADQIRQSHTFSKVTENLVELTNGCVCCTLRDDLIQEATRLLCMKRFDLLLVEATGISEPMPIAATFTAIDFDGSSLKDYFTIDNMVTVVDGSEFLAEVDRGASLKERAMEAGPEDDRSISTLLIEQVEFANTILVNKCDQITPDIVSEIRQFLQNVSPFAHILESVKADVDLSEIIGTRRFKLDRAEAFDGFQTEITQPHTSEAVEFGIGSFVFESKRPFHPVRLHRFFFCSSDDECHVADRSVLRGAYRSKGVFYLASHPDVKLTWSTAGRSVDFEVTERWLVSMLPDHIRPRDDENWDETFGDREQKIVIIGGVDSLPQIQECLTACLVTADEIAADWTGINDEGLWNLEALSDEESSVEMT